MTDYAPKETIAILDAKDFMFEGIILKEKEFRNTLKEFDLSVYADKIVALYCSSDAIVPMWAFMLLTSYLNNSASKIYFVEKEEVFQKIFSDNIDAIDATEFEKKKEIGKGGGQVPLTEALYNAITKKRQNTDNSLMCGEACSTVHVYKKK